MSSIFLTAEQCRVIGCLLEKSVVTPDAYPMTLNALTNACNQKSSRNPVMNLSQGMVQHTVRELEEMHLIKVEENFKRGVEKYHQRFCNTRYSNLQFDEAQFAIVTLLLLRGPQTPGELRSHSGRLHSFSDNEAVKSALLALIDRDDGEPLVIQLPRTPGRKDSEFMHLFSGEIDVVEYAEAGAAAITPVRDDRTEELAERVSVLESELAEIKKILQG